jgi:hypothetical protein
MLPIHFTNWPVYSLDASALIFCDIWYPADVLPVVWRFLHRMAAERRILVAEDVAKECDSAEDLNKLMQAHPDIVIEFGEFQDHFAQLMREAKGHNLMLVDPRSTKNAGDPHVIALALFLEQRDLRDMPKVQRASARCLVVSHEAPRNPAAALARIPDVAAHYRLQHISLVDMLRAEGLQAEVARDSEGLLR